MARIVGVDLPNEKRIDVALSYIYGIGPVMSKKILEALQIDPATRLKQLNEDQISHLNTYIQSNYKVEGDLRREVQQNVKRLIEIGAYRGSRHRRNLPARGQRTKTNARTRRGKRRTVGASKAAAAAKAAPAAKK